MFFFSVGNWNTSCALVTGVQTGALPKLVDPSDPPAPTTDIEETAFNRHIEFWIFPHADTVILKTLTPCDPCDPPASTTDIEETAFRRLLDVGAKLPFLTPFLQRLMMKTRFAGARRGPAHALFPRSEEHTSELPSLMLT